MRNWTLYGPDWLIIVLLWSFCAIVVLSTNMGCALTPGQTRLESMTVEYGADGSWGFGVMLVKNSVTVKPPPPPTTRPSL